MADTAKNPKDYPLPPGSGGLPLLGEVLAFRKDGRRFFLERFRKYGPIFQTRLGGKVVCLVGPEAVTFLQDTRYFDRVDANGPPAPLMNSNALPLLSGDKHAVRKTLVNQALSRAALNSYLPLLESIVERWISRWHVLTEFTWLDEFEKFGTGLTNALLLGELTGSTEPDLEETYRRFANGLGALPLNLPFTPYRKSLRSRDKLSVLINESIALHRKARSDGEPFNNIMTGLINARDGNNVLDDEALRDEVLHLFLAFTAVRLVLTAMCLGLGQHRAVMQQARDEVLDKCPTDPLTRDLLPLTMDTLDKLKYLGALAREVRRINPPVPNTFLSRVKEDTVFNNYRVKKGWKAIGGLYATMNVPETFDDPFTFDPERFSKERSGRSPGSYCPQGVSSEEDLADGEPFRGHRCAGEPFIDTLMKVVAVHLLRGYTWSLPPQDLTYTTDFFPVPRDGLKVLFRPLYTDS